MRPEDHAEMLRDVGLTPTIQRLAILDYLQRVKCHPTADEALVAVQRKFPSISRATVYNTLDALTKAGMILRLNVDPTVARYDADLVLHAHFRCRLCGKVYDIELVGDSPIDGTIEGHRVESVRTYAYGVCASCIEKEPPDGVPNEQKRAKPSSATYSPDRREGE